MQSSVRSTVPSLRDIGRTNSSNSIQIDQEVSVVSSQGDAARQARRRSTHSSLPSSRNGYARPSRQGGTATISAPQLNRWNSESRISGISRASSRDRTQQNQSSTDMDALRSNRESMKALADFLRTKEPPPNNFMSLPDSDTMSLNSVKKSALNVFGRQKSRKSKRSRLLQLPDTAVSAKTLGGARHIAISIPIEYDHLDNFPPPQVRPHSQPNRLPSERRGPVVVLKPVREVRESVSTFSASQDSHGKRDSRLSAGSTHATDVLGPETARTIENYYTQLSRQQTQAGVEGSNMGATPLEPSRTPKSYIAVSQQDSGRSVDLRNSGGTTYSTVSIATNLGHSRGASSVSTTPALNPLGINPVNWQRDLPPRSSSISNVPRSLQAELVQSFADVNDSPSAIDVNSPVKPKYAEGLSLSPQSPTTVRTIVGPYDSTGNERSRLHTPRTPHPAPTRRLPDVPESPLVPDFMPRPSPPPSERKENSPVIVPSPKVAPRLSKVNSEDPNQAAHQSRQDRVRARKARDIAALREKSTNPQSLSDISREPSQSMRPSSAPQPTKRRSISQERLRRRKQSTISAIMLVADLTPVVGADYLSDIVPPSDEKNVTAIGVSSPTSYTTMSAKGTHTPPRSFISSNFSDSETIPKEERRSRHRDSISPRSRSALDSRRQDRRYKRNMTLKEKELETRLQKIERDNAMLLNTLSGIAKSFGDLNKVLPRSRPRKDGGLLLGSEMEGLESNSSVQVTKSRSLEPVMRDLQGAAGRVSGELRNDDFDEDDGASIY